MQTKPAASMPNQAYGLITKGVEKPTCRKAQLDSARLVLPLSSTFEDFNTNFNQWKEHRKSKEFLFKLTTVNVPIILLLKNFYFTASIFAINRTLS